MRAKRRAAERGAVFIEAIIVVIFFIVALTGVTYFHKLYVGKLRVMRLSRAAALHYAINACQGSASGDLSAVGGLSPGPSGTEGNGADFGSDPLAGASSDAQSALKGQSGISSLNAQIARVSTAGAVAAQGGGVAYGSKTNTTSWVGCADKTSNDQYTTGLISQAISAISEL